MAGSLLAEQFPSNVYTWRELAGQRGAEVLTIERPPDDDWTGAVLASLDERVAIAALPHCHWTDGGLLDLVAIGRRCREVGCALVLDVTQSLGALPLDLAAVAPDFLVCPATIRRNFGIATIRQSGGRRPGYFTMW